MPAENTEPESSLSEIEKAARVFLKHMNAMNAETTRFSYNFEDGHKLVVVAKFTKPKPEEQRGNNTR